MAVSQSLALTETKIDSATNTSTVYMRWVSIQSGESYNDYTRSAKFYVSINGGTEQEYYITYTLPKDTHKEIVSKYINVPHRPDGTGSVTVRTWMDTGISAGVIEITKTLTLNTIARASTIDGLVCTTDFFNGDLVYSYTPKNSSFYNRCNIALNLDGEYIPVKTINHGQKAAGTSQGGYVILSEDELSKIYNKLPNTKTGKLRFTLRTYSDSGYTTQIGEGDYIEISLSIPNISATQPTATMTLTPVTSLPSPFNTIYVKGKSKVKVDLMSGEGKYGATIASYKVSVGSASGTPPYTSGYLGNPGNITITGTVTDSRGYSRTYTETITVIDYSNPRLLPASDESEVIAARCDSSGNLSDKGTYLKIKAKRSCTKVYVSGENKNHGAIGYRYKKEGGKYSSWSTILDYTDTSDEVSTSALLGGALSVASTYVVQVQVVDSIGEITKTTLYLPTEKVYSHKAASIGSFGFGKYAEEADTFDIAKDKTLRVRGDLKIGAGGLGVADFICEDTISGSWRCRKWNSGVAEAYGSVSVTVYPEGVYGSLYYEAVDINLPSDVFTATPYIQIQTLCAYGLFAAHLRTLSKSAINIFISNSNLDSRGELEVTLFIFAFGKWK